MYSKLSVNGDENIQQGNTFLLEGMVKFLPDTIKYVSCGVYPDVDVRDNDLVLFGFFFISEESVGHPNLGGIGQSQIIQLS